MPLLKAGDSYKNNHREIWEGSLRDRYRYPRGGARGQVHKAEYAPRGIIVQSSASSADGNRGEALCGGATALRGEGKDGGSGINAVQSRRKSKVQNKLYMPAVCGLQV